MIEVYEVNGGICNRLEWKGIINPAVAQLAGYSIVETVPSFSYLTYFIRRKTYNRF